MSDIVSKNLDHALRWIDDPSIYDQFELPPFRRYKARFTKEELEELEQANKFRICTPRCGVKAFCVPEWNKNRKRGIFWPDVNAVIPKSALKEGYIPRKDEVRRKCFESRFSRQFDLQSFYDQLPLHPSISPLFSVDGKSCLTSLPMGFRPSAEVAQCVTVAITDFQLPKGVNCVVYIDNIRFGGPSKEAVNLAAETFIARASACGAILNEYITEPSTCEDFLGEHYNLRKKRRSLTAKILEKLKIAEELVGQQLTFRQVSAVYGLLFFCSDVLSLDISRFFVALRFYRRTMASVSQWDDPAPDFDEATTTNLAAWIKEARANKSVPLWTDCNSFFPDLTIFTDASAVGWGAVAISDSGVKHFSGRWSTADVQQGTVHSTRAEPLAVQRAVMSAVSTNCRQVLVMSDHQGLIFAGNAGYGKSEAYNTMCATLKTVFPDTKFKFCFVAGVENTVADELSRNPAPNEL